MPLDQICVDPVYQIDRGSFELRQPDSQGALVATGWLWVPNQKFQVVPTEFYWVLHKTAWAAPGVSTGDGVIHFDYLEDVEHVDWCDFCRWALAQAAVAGYGPADLGYTKTVESLPPIPCDEALDSPECQGQ